jgi:hypothetical protein
MSITSISGSSVWSAYQATNTVQGNTPAIPAPGNDGSRPGPGLESAAGKTLTQALMQTLSDLGVSTANTPVAAASSSSGTDGTKDATNAANNPALGDALHAFMHSLFQALNQPTTIQANTSADTAATSYSTQATGYASLNNRLDSLVQTLNSGANPNGSSATDVNNLNGLSDAYQALLLALQDEESKRKKQGLSSLLAQLVLNMQEQGVPLGSTGSIISTKA